jgi:hypothetical protein
MTETTKKQKAESRKQKTGKHAGGRPTEYRALYAEIAYGFALAGYTDKEMAHFFSVSEQTLNVWKQKHPKFVESLKRGKDLADADVARGLYKAATGHHVKAVKILQSEGESYEHEFLEYHPPNPTAAIFWLKNRQRDKWRDVNRVAVTDAEGNDATHQTVEELQADLARAGILDARGRFVVPQK